MTAHSRDTAQLDRLTFFSDAVFAIAITLLVIEVHAPELEKASNLTLSNALLALIPQYIGFVVSFFVIGRFWLGHHRAFGLLARIDDTVVWRNLLFLLTIAFMPFPTALVSRYASLAVATCSYAAWLTLAGLLNRWTMLHAMRTPTLRAAGAAPESAERMLRSAWSPILIGVLAFCAGLIQPLFALIPLLGSPLILRLLDRLYVSRVEVAAGVS